MNQHTKQTLNKPDIHRFHLALERNGVDTHAVYERLGVDPGAMSQNSASLSMSKHYEMLELAAEFSGDGLFGIKLGLDERNSNLGMLTYMLRNAPDLEKAVDLLRRYVVLVAPGAEVGLRVDKDGEQENNCVLTYSIRDIPPHRCRQAMEMTLAQYVHMLRIMLQKPRWQPDRVYFEHGAPPQELLDNFPLGKEQVFNHYFSGVSFPKSFMQYANNDFDPDLLALLEAQVLDSVSKLQSSQSLVDHIRVLVSSNLGNEDVTADTIALELGVSRRSLYRRLQEHGTTFNQIREDVVLQIAKETLSTTSVSITELAQKLGYSDSSAFDRAFKRLAGVNPLQYRKRHRDG